MKHLLLAATAAASLILPLAASEPAQIASPGEIAEAAPASDWIAIAPSDLLVMDLAPDAKGPSTRSGPRPTRSGPRRVIIQLMPAPFSQGWIGNLRKRSDERRVGTACVSTGRSRWWTNTN